MRVRYSAAMAAAVIGVAAAPAHGATESTPSVGTAALDPAVRNLTVLVVGDSWARNLGAGMAEVGKAHGNAVVNAAEGGCGIMLSIKQAVPLIPTPESCRKWPKTWPKLVAQYHPQAVLLGTAFVDQGPQLWGKSGKARNILDPVFRHRYDANMDRAIRILSAQGAAVFLTNGVISSRHQDPIKPPPPLNEAVASAVERNSARNVHLLDLHAQLCLNLTCPREIDGITVYDEVAHPTVPARERLGKWILNTMWQTLHPQTQPAARPKGPRKAKKPSRPSRAPGRHPGKRHHRGHHGHHGHHSRHQWQLPAHRPPHRPVRTRPKMYRLPVVTKESRRGRPQESRHWLDMITPLPAVSPGRSTAPRS